MTLLAAAHGAGGLPGWPAGVCAWLGAILLWPGLPAMQRKQALWLGGIGLLALISASMRGAPPSVWLRPLTQNTGLLGMLAAVSFLQLLAPDDAPQGELPQGRAALWRTLLGVHLLGAVINISVFFIMADRFRRAGGPHLEQAAVLVRGFLAAALWSPFFAAMAVALTYAPGARLGDVAMFSVPFTLLLLLFAGLQLQLRLPDRGRSFVGYPMRPDSLALPALLALLVMLAHHWLPGWSSLSVISLCAIGLAAAVSLRRGLGDGGRRLGRHVSERLPAMAGELALFLAAGVFASGLQALIEGGFGWLPFDHFGPVQAALLLALMMLLALAGVHAIVSISIASAWLMPLAPDPVLLALVFLQSWAVGLAGGPLSGVHLALQGRYGLSAARMARENAGYCIGGWLLCSLWLWAVAAWRGVDVFMG